MTHLECIIIAVTVSLAAHYFGIWRGERHKP